MLAIIAEEMGCEMSRKSCTIPRTGLREVDVAIVNYRKWYTHYWDYLYGITVNSIIWENLPNTVNKRYLEVTLAEKGYALFFSDEVLGYLALKCTIGGELDVYDIPVFRQAISNSGYRRRRNNTNSVLIFNNYQREPDISTINLYASMLARARMGMKSNLDIQKFPLLILCDEKQRLSMQQVYEQYSGDVPVIFGNKNLDIDGIKVLKTDAPFVTDKLEMSLHQIFNDFLSWVGIENSNQDKKERLVSDEVGSNYGNVESSRNIRLNARKDACEEINNMFGLNVNCRFNSDLATLLNSPAIMNGGDENEQVYNTSALDSGDGDA